MCVWLIATGVASKPSFRNYPHIEDMVGDAVENCSKALTKFDATKTQNPFGYFTQTVYNAFFRRIDLEKKQLAIKHKYATKMVVFNELVEHAVDGEDHQITPLTVDNTYMSDNAAALDKKRDEAKVKRQSKAKNRAK